MLKNKNGSIKFKQTLKREDALLAISCFEKIDIFGAGWLLFLPTIFRKNLNVLGLIKSKEKVLQSYRFSVTFENIEKEGYFTEKVVESVLYGCCPIVPNDFANTKKIPQDLFCRIDEYLKERDKISKAFQTAYRKKATLSFLLDYSVEKSVKSIIECLFERGWVRNKLV